MILSYKERYLEMNFDIKFCRNMQNVFFSDAGKSTFREILGWWGQKCSFSERK